ncbi:segregation/condensation protein A [Patescibacteria group bacterium]|nr:segregation/condensation protein A [Patescibacteria group bacterium]MBU4601187.1 segregation/condensation protein A [Patescibacteria group bacterium]MCG2698062.1 segregation/condensation protein A [Candidatus Parcubacteria bacterium]
MIDIKIEKFQGPLNLLLQLIEKEEMDIAEVSLAKIADQYIEYIKITDKISPDDMADFLVVAARLLLIKSKALLPYLCAGEEEEEIKELENQLKMYKEFLEAAKGVDFLLGKKKFMFGREFNRKLILNNLNFFSPPKKLTAENMANVFKELIGGIRPLEKIKEEKLEHKISIEDKILSIRQMLINKIKFNFNRILQHAKSKTEIIVSFLAMLELIKQKDVIVTQEALFGDMEIMKN